MIEVSLPVFVMLLCATGIALGVLGYRIGRSHRKWKYGGTSHDEWRRSNTRRIP